MGRNIDKTKQDVQIGRRVISNDEEGHSSGGGNGRQIIMMSPGGASNEHDRRIIKIWGDVNEEMANIICSQLFDYAMSGIKTPINIFINTYGGSAYDMMAMYDTIKLIQKTLPVRTYGIGKVMSAGVLLLAAGQKGERVIAPNARIMIHELQHGSVGGLTSNKNEVQEALLLEDTYKKALVKETKMSLAEIEKMFSSTINNYIGAEQAIKLGLVDNIWEVT